MKFHHSLADAPEHDFFVDMELSKTTSGPGFNSIPTEQLLVQVRMGFEFDIVNQGPVRSRDCIIVRITGKLRSRRLSHWNLLATAFLPLE
jgi:hypothetical protein